MFSPVIFECFEILQNDFLPLERYTSAKRNADKKAHLAFPTATKHHPLNASTPQRSHSPPPRLYPDNAPRHLLKLSM